MRNIVLVTQIGFSMVIHILLSVYIGMKIDKWLGTNPIFLVLLLIIGVLSGFYNVYRMIMTINKLENKNINQRGDK